MIYKLAWRNIWRNKVRSGIIAGSIGIGLFSGILLISLVQGWSDNFLKEHIEMQTAHIQIHRQEYNESNDVRHHFSESALRRTISALPEVKSSSFRLKANAILATAEASIGITLLGVEAEQEQQVSRICSTVADSAGSFLGATYPRQIVLSHRVAQRLNAHLGSEIVLTLQDVSGELQSTLFTLGGIYSTYSRRFDLSTAYVCREDLRQLLQLAPDEVHEVALLTNQLEESTGLAERLSEALPHLDVQSWCSLYPPLQLVITWMDVMNLALLTIFLIALSFGIINTMLVSVLERQYELQMLGIIGMQQSRLLYMVLCETFFLTLTGASLGMAAALITIAATAQQGIDIGFLQGEHYSFGFGGVLYPVLSPAMFAKTILLIFAVALCSSILPLRKVRKMKV